MRVWKWMLIFTFSLLPKQDAFQPFRSMIEVIVKFLIERAMSTKEGENIPEQRSNTELGRSEKKTRPSSARRKEGSEHKRTSGGSSVPAAKDSNHNTQPGEVDKFWFWFCWILRKHCLLAVIPRSWCERSLDFEVSLFDQLGLYINLIKFTFECIYICNAAQLWWQ